MLLMDKAHGFMAKLSGQLRRFAFGWIRRGSRSAAAPRRSSDDSFGFSWLWPFRCEVTSVNVV